MTWSINQVWFFLNIASNLKRAELCGTADMAAGRRGHPRQLPSDEWLWRQHLQAGHQGGQGDLDQMALVCPALGNHRLQSQMQSMTSVFHFIEDLHTSIYLLSLSMQRSTKRRREKACGAENQRLITGSKVDRWV